MEGRSSASVDIMFLWFLTKVLDKWAKCRGCQFVLFMQITTFSTCKHKPNLQVKAKKTVCITPKLLLFSIFFFGIYRPFESVYYINFMTELIILILKKIDLWQTVSCYGRKLIQKRGSTGKRNSRKLPIFHLPCLGWGNCLQSCSKMVLLFPSENNRSACLSSIFKGKK